MHRYARILLFCRDLSDLLYEETQRNMLLLFFSIFWSSSISCSMCLQVVHNCSKSTSLVFRSSEVNKASEVGTANCGQAFSVLKASPFVYGLHEHAWKALLNPHLSNSSKASSSSSPLGFEIDLCRARPGSTRNMHNVRSSNSARARAFRSFSARRRTTPRTNGGLISYIPPNLPMSISSSRKGPKDPK